MKTAKLKKKIDTNIIQPNISSHFITRLAFPSLSSNSMLLTFILNLIRMVFSIHIYTTLIILTYSLKIEVFSTALVF